MTQATLTAFGDHIVDSNKLIGPATWGCDTCAVHHRMIGPHVKCDLLGLRAVEAHCRCWTNGKLPPEIPDASGFVPRKWVGRA